MISVVWALLCKQADFRNGDLEMRGEFVSANYKNYPAKPPHLFMAVRLACVENIRLETRIISPTGITIDFNQSDLIKPTNGQIRYVRRFDNVIFPTPGIYSFDLLRDDNLIHSCKLTMLNA